MSSGSTQEWLPYSKREEWSDVHPIFHDDLESSVVNIAYSDKFAEIFGYFRAILQKDERSERAFQLSTDTVLENPANYTAWHYRRILLKALKKDLDAELQFCADVISDNPKNYQVWHHRKILVQWLNSPGDELTFVALILRDDSKNYHAWQHRHWVVQHFNLFANELEYCNMLLTDDVRNNSAWNYRYFVINNTTGFTGDVLQRELSLTQELIKKVPRNESAWNYLNGILLDSKVTSRPDIWQFCEQLYASSAAHRSPYLLAFMVDYLVQQVEDSHTGGNEESTLLSDQKRRIVELCEELVSIDPVRRNYWKYIMSQSKVQH